MNVEVVDEVRVVDERFYGDDEARPRRHAVLRKRKK